LSCPVYIINQFWGVCLALFCEIYNGNSVVKGDIDPAEDNQFDYYRTTFSQLEFTTSTTTFGFIGYLIVTS
jgi:hypothetical protein